MHGASKRLAPILMTALGAGFALVPIAMGIGEAGKRDSSSYGYRHFLRVANLDGPKHDRGSGSILPFSSERLAL